MSAVVDRHVAELQYYLHDPLLRAGGAEAEAAIELLLAGLRAGAGAS